MDIVKLQAMFNKMKHPTWRQATTEEHSRRPAATRPALSDPLNKVSSSLTPEELLQNTRIMMEMWRVLLELPDPRL